MLLASYKTLAGFVPTSIIPAASVFLFGLSVPGLAALDLKLAGLRTVASGVSTLPLVLHCRRRRLGRKVPREECGG